MNVDGTRFGTRIVEDVPVKLHEESVTVCLLTKDLLSYGLTASGNNTTVCLYITNKT